MKSKPTSAIPPQALHAASHDHACVAACLAEHGRPRTAGPVLGVMLDGRGFSADGSLGGGEFLCADYSDCTRLAALASVAMPGGARALREPWRNTYAHIDRALGWRLYRAAFPRLALTRFLERRPLKTLDRMLALELNSPPTSSCGRLFDAVAAAVGLCRDSVSHEGEAARELEGRVDESALRTDAGYPFDLLPQQDGLRTLEPAPMWRALLADLARGVPTGAIAARFHRGVAQAIGRTVRQVRCDNGPAAFDTVVLTGDVFQNRTLLEQVLEDLAPVGLCVLTPGRYPATAGGDNPESHAGVIAGDPDDPGTVEPAPSRLDVEAESVREHHTFDPKER